MAKQRRTFGAASRAQTAFADSAGLFAEACELLQFLERESELDRCSYFAHLADAKGADVVAEF